MVVMNLVVLQRVVFFLVLIANVHRFVIYNNNSNDNDHDNHDVYHQKKPSSGTELDFGEILKLNSVEDEVEEDTRKEKKIGLYSFHVSLIGSLLVLTRALVLISKKAGFYHLEARNEWREVMEDQFVRLGRSGLLNETKHLFVGIENGDEDLRIETRVNEVLHSFHPTDAQLTLSKEEKSILLWLIDNPYLLTLPISERRWSGVDATVALRLLSNKPRLLRLLLPFTRFVQQPRLRELYTIDSLPIDSMDR